VLPNFITESFNQFVSLCDSSPIFFYVFIILLSLTIGSFLNVVIYRLPKMLEQGWYAECREFLSEELVNIPEKKSSPISLSKPDSTCPHCGHNIRFYENVPIISWLFLRGKCSDCKAAISIRYPLVELSTALLSLLIAHHYGVSMQTFWGLLLTWSLISLTLIDFDHMILPDQIVMPILWLGILININGTFVPLEQSIIGAVAGYMSLFSVFWIFKLITGKEGMGYGDFKLFALFGAWFGWQLLPLMILMASAVGAIVGISLIIFKQYNRQQAIPFGPYLAIAGWICLLWGDPIWQWYLKGLV
jgi:leader peptidase (prepilin peptidase)/N-methyltransferase